MAFTTNRSIFNTLQEENLIKAGTALDLGCGKGRDALNLSKAGFKIDAVDSDHEVIDALIKMKGSLSINAILSRIEDFDIRKNYYVLASCQFVLHFIAKEAAKKIIKNMTDGCIEDGIITFTLLGENDEWKNKWSTWTKSEADNFLQTLPVKIQKTVIEEGMGQTKAGYMKYWHVFNYVLIKKDH